MFARGVIQLVIVSAVFFILAAGPAGAVVVVGTGNPAVDVPAVRRPSTRVARSP